MSTILETLRAARELLSDPAHWTKGVEARTASGIPVDPANANACCWCTAGAIFQVSPAGDSIVRLHVFGALAAQAGRGVADYNDLPETTHAGILSWFDKTIEAVSAKELKQ